MDSIKSIKNLQRTYLKNVAMFLFGVALTAFANVSVAMPNKIVGGGVSGISTVLNHTLGVEPGLSTIVINVFLLIVAFRALGLKFVLQTLAAAGLMSGFMQIFTLFPPLTTNTMLATLFGGGIYGAGIGFALASGGSTGGTDILGRLFQKKFPHMPIGTILLIIDGLIIGGSYFIFKDIELALYGVLLLIISTTAIDMLIRKLNVSKLAFIVTTKGDDVANKIITSIPRGCTIINAVGAYTKNEIKMLVCALKDSELPEFQRAIHAIDSGAFIIFSESSQIVGNGFHVYR